ncbi:DUF960 domain-containing protein [Lactovum miscens]|uniref:Uncharacterized protein n=1 Tax=Lactovum miscens TaxID=190387 RepID=A0A841C6P4_9LACT|nr:DUF960 domain-containing protein [Lactovum miscens]MBB5887947.1 hypothetical protein [Lactovum miscens]
MAFANTKRRYASFGTVESIPGDIIDLFWYLIDNDLKGAFPLSTVLNFELIQTPKGQLSVRFSQDDMPEFSILFDTSYGFDRRWPRLFHAVDNTGRETITTPAEMI